jgi:predicted nuclease of predicted toxin-antitoxin system
MEMAYNEGRILLTEDKDFGWLAFVGRLDNPGVILIRFPATARLTLAASVTKLVRGWAQALWEPSSCCVLAQFEFLPTTSAANPSLNLPGIHRHPS